MNTVQTAVPGLSELRKQQDKLLRRGKFPAVAVLVKKRQENVVCSINVQLGWKRALSGVVCAMQLGNKILVSMSLVNKNENLK